MHLKHNFRAGSMRMSHSTIHYTTGSSWMDHYAAPVVTRSGQKLKLDVVLLDLGLIRGSRTGGHDNQLGRAGKE